MSEGGKYTENVYILSSTMIFIPCCTEIRCLWSDLSTFLITTVEDSLIDRAANSSPCRVSQSLVPRVYPFCLRHRDSAFSSSHDSESLFNVNKALNRVFPVILSVISGVRLIEGFFSISTQPRDWILAKLSMALSVYEHSEPAHSSKDSLVLDWRRPTPELVDGIFTSNERLWASERLPIENVRDGKEVLELYADKLLETEILQCRISWGPAILEDLVYILIEQRSNVYWTQKWDCNAQDLRSQSSRKNLFWRHREKSVHSIMGACCGATLDDNTRMINSKLKDEERDERGDIKLLFLGLRHFPISLENGKTDCCPSHHLP